MGRRACAVESLPLRGPVVRSTRDNSVWRLPMSRYFFHIKEGDETIVDEEGEEFDTVESVRKVAVESAREIMSQDVLVAGRFLTALTFGEREIVGRK